MGKPIVYCGQCGKSLLEADFEKRRAQVLDNKPFCARCRPLPPVEHPEKEDSDEAPATPHRVSPRNAPRSSEGDGARTKAFLVPVLGVAGVGTLLLAAFVLSDSHKSELSTGSRARESEPRSTTHAPTDATDAVPLNPRELAAKKAFDRAEEFKKAFPTDLDGQLRLREEALAACEHTALYEGARLERDRIAASRSEMLTQRLREIETGLRNLLAREEFKKAIDLLQEAKSRRDDPEWTGRIGQKIRQIQDDAFALWAQLKGKVLDAKRRGSKKELKEFSERVATWGLPEIQTELVNSLVEDVARPPNVSPAPTPPPPSKEAALYLLSQRRAITLAAARDYVPAVEELARGLSDLKDATLRKEAEADREALRQISLLVREAQQGIAKWLRGKAVSLDFWNPQGAPETFSGTVRHADAFRVEITNGDASRLIGLGEIRARTLTEVALHGSDGETKKDKRVLAALLALEGETEPATQVEPGSTPLFSSRFSSEAQEMALARAAGKAEGSERDSEARRLFYQLEAQFFDFSKTADAVPRYLDLLKDYADSAFVRRNRASIQDRAAGGKEYLLFAEDMFPGGGFERSKHPKCDRCFTMAKDAEGARLKDNYVDLPFSTLPHLDYRLWVYIGACCAETFAFNMQATGLAGPNPKNKSETILMEPGGDLSVPVRNSIVGLKKSHSAHGGPKQPVRWEWVAIPLPKSTTAGKKVVRILSDQKGFSIGYAFVSSVRLAPLRESEIEEAEAGRPLSLRGSSKGAAGLPVSAPGKIIFSENFDTGRGRFQRGELVQGGTNGSQALAVLAEGIEIWGAWSVPVKETVTVSLRLKPLVNVNRLLFMVWSDRLKDNGRYYLENLKEGEWREIRFKTSEFRVGSQRDGPVLDLFANLKIELPDGPADAKILLDDFVIGE